MKQNNNFIIMRSKNTSPYYNLVMEEMMVKDETIKDDIIFLYQHQNAVFIGRNQNAHEEIKKEVLVEKNIDLYRRLSGGGAVYQDLGNINFSLITKNENNSYEKFLNPVIEFLKSLGINAQFKGRNDLVIDGMKFSGNAQFIHKGKMVHHGTILFDVNLGILGEILKPHPLKFVSKGIQSVRQRVVNIKDVLKEPMTIDEFIDKFIQFLVEKYNATFVDLPDYHDNVEFIQLQSIRSSEEWLYGQNPRFSVVNMKKFDGGILKVKVNTDKDKITNVNFEGDFLSTKDVNDVVKKLIGVSYDVNAILEVLSTISLQEYFGTITKEEIASLFTGAKVNN